jgi:hypothetical protein
LSRLSATSHLPPLKEAIEGIRSFHFKEKEEQATIRKVLAGNSMGEVELELKVRGRYNDPLLKTDNSCTGL